MAPLLPASAFARLVSEVGRRHVAKVAVAYGAVGFVLLQMAEIVLPAFLPGFEADAALRVVVVAFLLLCPVVVALAWVYEITPQGVRSMETLDAQAGRTPMGGLLPRVAFLVLTALLASTAGLWWYRTDAAALAAAEVQRAQRFASFASTSRAGAAAPATGSIGSVAVLPLDDFSMSDGDLGARFAAGMHEVLISDLSQLGSLRVTSRTSTEAYSREGRSVRQIGADLGVDAVIEGSVLEANGRVRIVVQLIDVASDTHLWAADFESDLTDVIALQRDVSTEVAAAVQEVLAVGAIEAVRVAESEYAATATPVPVRPTLEARSSRNAGATAEWTGATEHD